MASIRDFVANKLSKLIVNDAKALRILNESDLQVRVAFHLDKNYAQDSEKIRVYNQPYIPVGKGRGAGHAKPDILIVDDKGPYVAMELKCVLLNADRKLPDVETKLWEDIGALARFKQRYPHSEDAFLFALVDIVDIEAYQSLLNSMKRNREEWMKHYLHVHVLNMACDENCRKRNNYDEWARQYLNSLDVVWGY